MEDMTVQFLERSLHEKILLYNDLLLCFKEEKEALVNVDLDRLWHISKKKEELYQRINDLRDLILRTLSPMDNKPTFTLNLLRKYVSKSDQSGFEGLYFTLQSLKNDINAAHKQNIRIADHSLRFLDEILSIIIGESLEKNVYNRKSRLGRSGRDMLLSREV